MKIIKIIHKLLSNPYAQGQTFVLMLAFVMSISLMIGCGDEESTSYIITLEPPPHFHAFAEATLNFKVTTEAGEPVSGISPVVAYQFQGVAKGGETKKGDIVDNGDGTYTWKRKFGDAGGHVITFKFEQDGIMHSNSFPFVTSKAGGERIFCPSKDNPKYAYQIRWEALPADIYAGDEVTFRIELKRSINEKIDIESPWLNTFDPLTPSSLKPAGSLPKVAIGAEMGEETPLTVTYKGMGIYEAKYKFNVDTMKMTYWFHVTFDDECGKIDESGKAGEFAFEYQFPVLPTK